MVMSTPRLPWFQKNENGENSENVSSALPNLLKYNHFDRRIRNRFCSDTLRKRVRELMPARIEPTGSDLSGRLTTSDTRR
jgi:hypothetical protein